MATRIKFQQNLDDLKERLLIMAGMAEQGSSRSKTSGSTARARAIQSRCCCPPESA